MSRLAPARLGSAIAWLAGREIPCRSTCSSLQLPERRHSRGPRGRCEGTSLLQRTDASDVFLPNRRHLSRRRRCHRRSCEGLRPGPSLGHSRLFPLEPILSVLIGQTYVFLGPITVYRLPGISSHPRARPLVLDYDPFFFLCLGLAAVLPWPSV